MKYSGGMFHRSQLTMFMTVCSLCSVTQQNFSLPPPPPPPTPYGVLVYIHVSLRWYIPQSSVVSVHVCSLCSVRVTQQNSSLFFTIVVSVSTLPKHLLCNSKKGTPSSAVGFCSLRKGITQKIHLLHFVLIDSVLLNPSRVGSSHKRRWVDPFTAPACKISGLKDARTRLQNKCIFTPKTRLLSVLWILLKIISRASAKKGHRKA